MLAENERRSSRRTTLLGIGVGEHRAFLGDAVNVGRLVRRRRQAYLASNRIARSIPARVKICCRYLSLANQHLKSSWRENWQLSWEAITHRRKPEFANQPSWYQQVQPSLPDNPLEPWFKNINRTREFYSTITRLRIGHCCAPSHINRIDIDPEASCECGLLAATLQHMVFECNIALAQRAELIQALERLTTAPPPGEHWSLINLLKKNNPNILDSLFRFIKSTNMPI